MTVMPAAPRPAITLPAMTCHIACPIPLFELAKLSITTNLKHCRILILILPRENKAGGQEK
jgi:hypothetical protein